MASNNQVPPRTPFKPAASTSAPPSSFHQQREALVGDIAMAMEQVLQNINKLNRSLEAVIAVGNEFGAVEALWSQFENVMAKQPGHGEDGEAAEEDHEGAGGEEEEQEEDAQGGAKSGGRK